MLVFLACVPLSPVCVLPLFPVCAFPVCASSVWDPSHLLAKCAFPVRVASSVWDPYHQLALSVLPARVILFPVHAFSGCVESHR